MGKTVVMFPGQGSQCTGMGKESYDRCLASAECFKIAEQLTGINMEHLIFEENDILDKTEYTQLALYVTEMAQLKDYMEHGLEYDAAIGLSLGEYSALTASGALSYEDGVRLVRHRGIYMEEAAAAGTGAMAAVIGLTSQEVDKALDEFNSGNQCVSVANYNCPGQIVISGECEQVKKAMEYLNAAGARRTILLNVSGPFHSPLLKGAGDKLANDLSNVHFEEIRHPYVANCTAEYITKGTSQQYIRSLLSRQVYSPVYFEQSVRKLIEDGYDTYIEVGPGRTLSGFVKKIAKAMDKKVMI